MNASFDGRPASCTLRSGRLLCVDPLALDGLSSELIELSRAASGEQAEMVRALGAQGLRMGLVTIPGVSSGTFELDLDSFEPVDPDSPDPSVFQIDSGTVVVIDIAALESVARVLTWDRYDALLQAPLDDDSALDALNREVGGPWFAIVSADANTAFSGDGAFRLRPDALRRVTA